MSMEPPNDDRTRPPRAGRREWIGLAVLALPCLVVTMDLTVLYLAVPRLSAELEPSATEVLWITDIYGFLIAGSLITMGTLGDRIGRRRVLLLGAAAFGAASVLAACSTSAGLLIAARAILGVAGATLAPSTLSLIRAMFLDPAQRTVAIAVWVTSFSVGAAIGPLVGGVLLELFWWGSVFLPAIPVMGLLLVLGPRLLPEYRDPSGGRLDLLSAAMSLVAVLAAIYGIKELAADGAGTVAVASIGAGLAVGVAFIRRQAVLEDPLIDLRLFRAPAFSASLGTYALSTLASFGVSFFLVQYLQLVLDLSPLAAGAYMLPSSAGFIVGSMVATRLVRHMRPAYAIAGGLGVAAAGLVVIGRADAGSGLAEILVGSVLVAVGFAPATTLGTDLIVGAAAPERAGAASAISEASAELGGALGVAVLGALGTAIYRAGIGDGLPAGVPADAAAAARESLGGAVAAGEGLAGELGAAVVDVAREAFVEGMQAVAIACAAIVAASAVLAAVALREVRRERPADAEPAPAAS